MKIEGWIYYKQIVVHIKTRPNEDRWKFLGDLSYKNIFISVLFVSTSIIRQSTRSITDWWITKNVTHDRSCRDKIHECWWWERIEVSQVSFMDVTDGSKISYRVRTTKGSITSDREKIHAKWKDVILRCVFKTKWWIRIYQNDESVNLIREILEIDAKCLK